jgi:hypothetical protein
MHQVILDRLEDYLAGSSDIPKEFTAHLESCVDCRDEVTGMRELQGAFAVLRAGEPFTPAPGFYARVSSRIERQQAGSFWRLLWEPALGRRVAFASLMALLFLGSFLISRETDYTPRPGDPNIIAAAPADDPDAILVSMVSSRP